MSDAGVATAVKVSEPESELALAETRAVLAAASSTAPAPVNATPPSFSNKSSKDGAFSGALRRRGYYAMAKYMRQAWVDAVLANDPDAARGHHAPRITRCLHALRRALQPRGTRQCGLVASSGARRLRAEGLGSVLPHQDADAVARWFGGRWPDIRSAGALETVGTEFAVQGLELDHVGLCWDADLVRGPAGWHARAFRGTAWTALRRPEALSNRLNAYRVLLTRARPHQRPYGVAPTQQFGHEVTTQKTVGPGYEHARKDRQRASDS